MTLYDKWRPLVPHDKRPSFKYYHTDPGEERRGNIKENKKQSAELRKNRSVTVQDDGDKKPAAKKTPRKKNTKVTAVKAKPTATKANKNSKKPKKNPKQIPKKK